MDDYKVVFRPGRGEWEIIKGRSAHLGWIVTKDWQYTVRWDPQRRSYHDINITTDSSRSAIDRVLEALNSR